MAFLDLHIEQLDVKIIFLHRELREIYLQSPDGVFDKNNINHVRLL